MNHHRTFRLTVYAAIVGCIVALLFLEATDANAGAFRASIDGCVSIEDASVTCQEPSSDDPTPDPDPCATETVGDRERGCGVIRYKGHGAEWWWNQMRRQMQRAERLERRVAQIQSLYTRPRELVKYGIALASVIYGVPQRELENIVSCESGGTYSAEHPSSHASGAAQFLPSTWARTPFADMWIFDPIASPLAAGWLWKQDGESWREWVCQPT